MFDVKTFNTAEYDAILSRGLSKGLGNRNSSMCIEAAICSVLGLEHGDDPGCVSMAVRSFKIILNDANWSTPKARAGGLRDLGLAQLGSLDKVEDIEFTTKLSKKIIGVLIPDLFRYLFKDNEVCLNAADNCEKYQTYDAANAAVYAADCAAKAADSAANAAAYADNYAAYTASCAANAAAYADNYAADNAVVYAANAAAYADNAAAPNNDYYLKLAAKLALEVLVELDSPGVALL